MNNNEEDIVVGITAVNQQINNLMLIIENTEEGSDEYRIACKELEKSTKEYLDLIDQGNDLLNS